MCPADYVRLLRENERLQADEELQQEIDRLQQDNRGLQQDNRALLEAAAAAKNPTAKAEVGPPVPSAPCSALL